MSIDIVDRLHALADDLGRASGEYVPAVAIIQTAIREITALRRAKEKRGHDSPPVLVVS